MRDSMESFTILIVILSKINGIVLKVEFHLRWINFRRNKIYEWLYIELEVSLYRVYKSYNNL